MGGFADRCDRNDYATLAGPPLNYILLDRLQSVLNAAARVIFSAQRCNHATTLLQELHWIVYTDSFTVVCTTQLRRTSPTIFVV